MTLHLLTHTGRHHLARPRIQHRRKGVFCTTHASDGNLHLRVPYARHASADPITTTSLFSQHQQALRAETKLPLWKPGQSFSAESARRPFVRGSHSYAASGTGPPTAPSPPPIPFDPDDAPAFKRARRFQGRGPTIGRGAEHDAGPPGFAAR